ncbi:Acetyltransferase adrJ [Cladobotryum mycophilum]|uniref:Acetyltransferase adrJ n=1 Tax=Cladobotryum mycophilum TaxID=491253 RepID=A0ABR0S9Z8_9HYPO
MASRKVSTDRVVPLLPYDTLRPLQHIVIRMILVFDSILDSKKLHDTLWHIVAEREGWSRFGARLRRSGSTGLEYHIPAKYSGGRPALNFNHTTHRAKIRDHAEGCQLLPSVGTETKAHLAPGEDFFMPKTGPNKLDDYLESDLPVLGLNVISFEDATVVVLHLPHVLTDGTGIALLLHAWVLALNNKEDKIPIPLAVDVDLLGPLDEEIKLESDKGWLLSDWQRSWLGWTWLNIRSLPRTLDPPLELKTIIVPAARMKVLREAALQDRMAGQETEGGKPPH